MYGTVASTGSLAGVPIAGILGDQQAATFGQACLDAGEAKNTYGTGNFLLLNTGTENGARASTACSRRSATSSATARPVYALEGSIAVTGSLVQWLRDNLGLIADADEIEALAASVDDNGGAYIVPGLLRAVRAVLAPGRARRDRRPDPLRQPRAHRPGRARGDRVPDPRGASRR